MNRRKDSHGVVLKDGEYQRADGTYEYRWTGKNHKKHSIYAQNLKLLREKEKEITAKKYEGIDIAESKMTLNDAYEMWKKLKRGLRENTFQNYCYMYDHYAADEIGNIRLVDLKKSDIRSFYNTLFDEAHVRASTIDAIQTVVHEALEIARDDDVIRTNPSENALRDLKQAHKRGTGKRMAMTKEQMKSLLQYILKSRENQCWLPLIVTLLFTGMRIGELTGLRWCDVDFNKKIIYVDHTLVYFSKRSEKTGHGKSVYMISPPKTLAGKRFIPMLPVVEAALLTQKRQLWEYGISCNVTIDGYTDFIFLNRFGGVLNNGAVNKVLRRIVRDCNYKILDGKGKSEEKEARLIPHISCHSFRHTTETLLNEVGVNYKARQDILGHSCNDVTDAVYTDTFIELRRKEMETLEPVIKEAFGDEYQKFTNVLPTKSGN